MGKIVNGVYYGSDGKPAHRGTIKIDGKIYYAGTDGVLVKNREKTIHHGMENDLVEKGTYRFDENGVLILSSYRPSSSSEKKKKDEKEKDEKKKTGVDGTISELKAKIEKEKKKMTKREKRALYWGLGLVGVLCLFFIGRAIVLGGSNSGQKSSGSTEYVMELPAFTDKVYLCSASMEQYYKGQSSLEDAIEGSGSTCYKAFEFNYTARNVNKATLYLKEEGSNADTVEYPIDVNASKLTIDNLKTGTSYTYRVTAEDMKKKTYDYSGSFTTADTNRFISFPGVYNTRDIGGYDTSFGKKVKQGILIRGTEMDGLVEPTYYLTDVESTKPFGFVCDFDLRNGEIFNTNYISPLGQDVTHKFYNSPQYGGIFAKGNEAYLKQIFSDLANAGNYPMYLHCTYGADRTGTIVFLLQGLLGVSEEDMIAEYKLTGIFSSSYTNGENLNSILSGLQGVEGNTINEKIENYLVGTIGVTAEQVNSIRGIFLE